MSQQKLIQTAYKVIKEEGLPEPKYIRFRYPKRGAIKSGGVCHKNAGGDEYHITIPLTTMKYTEDEHGVYIDTKTKGRFSGKLIYVSIKRLTEVMAHEIAHLKFWNHGPEHISYTEYILSKLNSHLNSDGGN